MARVVLARQAKCPFLCWKGLRGVLCRILREYEARGTLSVALVDDDEMRRVHREFLGEDAVTDVVSFRLDEPSAGPHEDVLGEIVISVETARGEALRRGKPPHEELALYAIHGALHLVGFDDGNAGDRREMRRVERKYSRLYARAAAGSGSRAGGGSRLST